MKALKLPFGLKNSQLIQVSDVESGLKCGCNCRACGYPLVAKKGKRKIHHFAHHKQPDCKYATETALHEAAKKVIEEAGYIVLPELKYKIGETGHRLIVSQGKLHFEEITLEKRFHNVIPDILIKQEGQFLNVEICVTHRVDEEKLEKIKESNLSTLEIDLSNIDRTIGFPLLKDLIVNSIENKKWLFHREYNDLKEMFIGRSKSKRCSGYDGISVSNCPKAIERSYRLLGPHFDNDCGNCSYCVEQYKNDNWTLRKLNCIGHLNEEEISNSLKTTISI